MKSDEMSAALIGRLSPAGKELLAEIERWAELPDSLAAVPKLGDRILELPQPDQDVLQRLMGFKERSCEASLAETREGLANLELAESVIERAQELERLGGKEPDEDATLREAIAVLERHGEDVPAGLDPNFPVLAGWEETEKIEHRSARVILDAEAEISPEVEREYRLVNWADALYANAIRIAAAGVLAKLGSLEIAASVLWWAGFRVPVGYFPEGHEGEGLSPDDEDALRLWVEGETEIIRRMIGSEGFRLAATGRLLDGACPPAGEEDDG